MDLCIVIYKYRDLFKEHREWRGIIIYGDGKFLEGQFKMGKLLGVCRIIYPNLDIYEGCLENNLYNGFGTLLKANGSSYTGNWKDNFPHGDRKSVV